MAAPRLSETCCRLTTDFWEVPLKRAAALEIQRAKRMVHMGGVSLRESEFVAIPTLPDHPPF